MSVCDGERVRVFSVGRNDFSPFYDVGNNGSVTIAAVTGYPGRTAVFRTDIFLVAEDREFVPDIDRHGLDPFDAVVPPE